MVNAWSLAHSILNGTLDEDYPIMNTDDEKAVVEAKKKNPDKSDSYFDYDRNGDMPNPFSTLSDNDDQIAHHVNAASSDTLNFGTPIPGGMGEDHINLSGVAGTQYDKPEYYARDFGDDPYPTLGSIEDRPLSQKAVDEVYAHHFPGTPTDMMDGVPPKPQPDLNYKSQKYQEDIGIKDLKDYVASTYRGHYTNKNSDTQTLDLIHSVGDAESFCRSNALKYLSRYDKKGSAKNDILKAMHYCLLLYYFSGNTQEPDYTNTRYETF